MALKGIFDIIEEEKPIEKKLPSITELIGEVPTEEVVEPEFKLEKVPMEMGVRPITELIEEKPVVRIAKSQVAYNISQKTGLPLTDVYANLDKVTKQLGIRGVPTSEEMLTAMFAFPVTAALLANPITAGIGVAKFLALTEAENYAISKLKKWQYKFGAGRGLKELLPEGTAQLAKDLVDVVDFVGKGYVIAKTDPKLMKMWQKFSKEIINTTSPAQQMFVSAKKLKDSGLTEAQIKQFFGLTTKQYNEAVSRGIDIQLPAIKAVELVDSPAWAKIKGFFNVQPFSKTVMMSSTGRIRPASLAITGAPDVSTMDAKAFLLKEGVSLNALNKLKPSSLKDLYYARKFGVAYEKKELIPKIPEVERAKIEEVPPPGKMPMTKAELVARIKARKAITEEEFAAGKRIPVTEEELAAQEKYPEVLAEKLRVTPEEKPLVSKAIDAIQRVGEAQSRLDRNKIIREAERLSGGNRMRGMRLEKELEMEALKDRFNAQNDLYEALGPEIRIGETIDFKGKRVKIESAEFKTGQSIQQALKTGFPASFAFDNLVGRDIKTGLPIRIYPNDIIDGKKLSDTIRINPEDILKEYLDSRRGVQEGVAEKPRETRVQLVDKLTKEAANKAAIVKAIEDAKAKPSEEAEAKLQIAEESLATKDQLLRAKFLIGQKGIETPTKQQTTRFAAFLNALTGSPTVDGMNQGQVQVLIETLERWSPKDVRVAYRVPLEFITQDLIDLIPGFREIGLKESIRDARHVWQKIHPEMVRRVYEPTIKAEADKWERLDATMKLAVQLDKTVKDIPDSRGRIWRAADNTLKEGEVLTSEETEVYNMIKIWRDKWADDLKLPASKRRKHYMTHLVESAIAKGLKEKNFLDIDYLQALEFKRGAKEIFDPYLKERKGLKGASVKEDWMAAMQAYEAYATSKFFYDPILKKINLYSRLMSPRAAEYAKEYTKRMTGEPSKFDKAANFTLGEFGAAVRKLNLPGCAEFADFLQLGNPVGTISYHMAGLLYTSFMGFVPRSAVRNAFQPILNIAEVGARAAVAGEVLMHTTEGKKLLKQCDILRMRFRAPLPDLSEVGGIKGKLKTVEDIALFLFKVPDIYHSVPHAFCSGYMEAKHLGLPEEYRIRRGNEVVEKCQFAYTKMAASLVSQSSGGRVLGVFTSWPIRFTELLYEWVAGKPSQVFLDYEKDTGTKVLPETWTVKQAKIIRYMAIIALASVIQRKTRFKALEYTGITALENLQSIVAGELAGLQIPGGTMAITVGMAMYMMSGDPALMKKGWNMLRPDKQVLIARYLKQVSEGKKDWMDLWLFLEKGEGLKKYPRLR